MNISGIRTGAGFYDYNSIKIVADFNAKYQPDASYDLKGVDSDISKLDVEKHCQI